MLPYGQFSRIPRTDAQTTTLTFLVLFGHLRRLGFETNPFTLFLLLLPFLYTFLAATNGGTRLLVDREEVLSLDLMLQRIMLQNLAMPSLCEEHPSLLACLVWPFWKVKNLWPEKKGIHSFLCTFLITFLGRKIPSRGDYCHCAGRPITFLLFFFLLYHHHTRILSAFGEMIQIFVE